MENRRNRLEGVKIEIEITRNYLQPPSTMFHSGNRILRPQCADNSAYYARAPPFLPPRSSQCVPKLFPVISRILSRIAPVSLPQPFAGFAVTRVLICVLIALRFFFLHFSLEAFPSSRLPIEIPNFQRVNVKLTEMRAVGAGRRFLAHPELPEFPSARWQR